MRPSGPARRLAVTAGLAVLSLAAAEGAYRLHLARKNAAWDRSLNYRMTPSVYVEYDARHGERLKPDSECWVCDVRDGRLVWGTLMSRSNRDGLGGRTTVEEYRRAPLKILVFGDSFTHWNQGGVTWPDLLEQNLARSLGRPVGVLDYARGGYGVLQMLDLAADEVEEQRPDLVVVAAIGADFNRARWWSKEVHDRGMVRWMRSTRDGDFADSMVAIDVMLVQPQATREWCLRRIAAGGGPDPVLDAANAQYRRLRDEVTAVRRGFHLFALNRSYLFRRLTKGDPFDAPFQVVPEIPLDDFAGDARTLDNLRRLKAAGVPLLFVYLPTAEEMKARESLVNRQTRLLMASLERLAGERIQLLQRTYTGPVPAKIDLSPHEFHPSRDGLQLYADAVTPLVLQRLQKTQER